MTRIKSALAAAIVLFACASPVLAGNQLVASDLKRLLPGRFVVTLYNNVSMTVTMRANGTVAGAAKGESDTGHWVVSGNRLCIGFNKWLGGQTRCSSLQSQGSYFQGSGFTFRRI